MSLLERTLRSSILASSRFDASSWDPAAVADALEALAKDGGDELKRRRVEISNLKLPASVHLDLSGWQSCGIVRFEDCEFQGRFSLRYAKLRGLEMVRCTVSSLDAQSLEVETSVFLSPQFVSQGTVRLSEARVGATCVLSGATLAEGNLEHFDGFGLESGESASGAEERHFARPFGALDARNCIVGGSFLMDALGVKAFEATGLVLLRGARIGGRFHASGAQLTALSFFEADATNGSGRYSDVVRKVVDSLDEPHKATLHTSDYMRAFACFDGYRMQVGMSAHWDQDFHGKGLVRISGIHIGGKLSFKRATLEELPADGPGRPSWIGVVHNKIESFTRARIIPRGALDAFAAQIGGGVYLGMEVVDLNDEAASPDSALFKSTGLVSFQAATITKRVVLGGCYCRAIAVCGDLCHANRLISVDFGGCKLGDNFHIRRCCTFIGTVRLYGTKLEGRLSIAGSTFCALDARQIAREKQLLDAIGKNLSHFGVSSEPPGWERLNGLREAVQESLRAVNASSIRDRRPHECQYRALDARNLQVGDDVCIDGFSLFFGTVSFRAATIAKDLSIVASLCVAPAWPRGDWNSRSKEHRTFVALDLDHLSCLKLCLARGHQEGRHGEPDEYEPLDCVLTLGEVYIHFATIQTVFDIRQKAGIRTLFSDLKLGQLNPSPLINLEAVSQLLHLEQMQVGTLADNGYTTVFQQRSNFCYRVIHRDSMRVVSPEARLALLRARYGHWRIHHHTQETNPFWGGLSWPLRLLVLVNRHFLQWPGTLGRVGAAVPKGWGNSDPAPMFRAVYRGITGMPTHTGLPKDNSQFRAQPFSQLAAVLWENGMTADSSRVIGQKIAASWYCRALQPGVDVASSCSRLVIAGIYEAYGFGSKMSFNAMKRMLALILLGASFLAGAELYRQSEYCWTTWLVATILILATALSSLVGRFLHLPKWSFAGVVSGLIMVAFGVLVGDRMELLAPVFQTSGLNHEEVRHWLPPEQNFLPVNHTSAAGVVERISAPGLFGVGYWILKVTLILRFWFLSFLVGIGLVINFGNRSYET